MVDHQWLVLLGHGGMLSFLKALYYVHSCHAGPAANLELLLIAARSFVNQCWLI